MRMFAAFVWLRWRLLVNSMRGAKRRDTLEQISRVLALLVPILIAVMSIGMVVGTTLMAFVGGRSAANGLMDPALALFIFRVALALMVGVLVVFAIIVPSQATLTRYARLLLLPIPRRMLHAIEVAASLADPWLLWMVPALLAFCVGLAVGGRVDAALTATISTVVLIALLAALNALVTFLVSWLVRNRRRSEIFTLVFVVGISAISLLPAFFAGNLDDRRRDRLRDEKRPPFSVEAFDRQLPAWTVVLPTELYGRSVLAGLRQDAGTASAAMSMLAAEFLVLFVLSGAVHARLLGTPEGGRRRSKRDATDVPVPELPLVGPVISTVAWAQFRTAMRSVRGRAMLFLSGPMVAVIVLVFSQIERDESWLRFLSGNGHVLAGAGGILALYSLQAFTMNMFGVDRAGLTLQFLAPVSDAELARGKTIGCLLLLLPTLALTAVASAAVAPNGSPFYWLSALLGVISVYLWMSPIAVWLSALFPQAADLSKTGTGGNPHSLPMFAGTLLVLLLAAPAAGILLAGMYWLHQPALTLGAMLAWTALAAAVAHPLVILASRAITLRRENLAMVAQGK